MPNHCNIPKANAMRSLTWAIDTRLVYRLFIKVGAVELRANQASKPAFGQPQASVFVSEEVELRYI